MKTPSNRLLRKLVGTAQALRREHVYKDTLASVVRASRDERGGGAPPLGHRPPGVVALDDDVLVGGDQGRGRYRLLNFRRGLTATDDGDRVDIDADVGVSCYDYIVIPSYTGTEGASVTMPDTSETTKFFSLLQLAVTEWASDGGDRAILYCGSTLEDVIVPAGDGSDLMIQGLGKNKSGLNGNLTNSDTSGTGSLILNDFRADTYTVSTDNAGDRVYWNHMEFGVIDIQETNCNGLWAHATHFTSTVTIKSITNMYFSDCTADAAVTIGTTEQCKEVYWRGGEINGTLTLEAASDLVDIEFDVTYRGTGPHVKIVGAATSDHANITLKGTMKALNAASVAKDYIQTDVDAPGMVNLRVAATFELPTNTDNETHYLHNINAAALDGGMIQMLCGSNQSNSILEDLTGNYCAIQGIFIDYVFILAPDRSTVETEAGSSNNVVVSGTPSTSPAAVGLVIHTSIQNAAGDTYVRTEETLDEKIVRIGADDTERMTIGKLEGVDIFYVATEADEHALELVVDAAGFGDVKVIEAVYDTGAIATGEDEAVILVVINQVDATGGEVYGYEVLATDGGADAVYGLKVGAEIGPILQDAGTFANPALATNDTASTDVPDMRDGSTGTNTTIFVLDNDYIIIGAVAAFTEMEFIIETPASNPGIKPTFEYSTAGTGQFTTFTPVDGTNGFRNTGVVAWDAADLTGHVADDVTGTFDIRITRTHAVAGSVSLFYAKTAATVVYSWGPDGDISVKDVTAAGVLSVSTPSELTITNTGVITVTQTYHTVDTFADAASDSLAAIIGGSGGDLLILRPEDDARTVLVISSSGGGGGFGIFLRDGIQYTMDDLEDALALLYDESIDSGAGGWFELARGGSAHAMLDGVVHSDSTGDPVTRGSLIYGNSTPKWDELVIGSAGRILKSDGTDIAWADDEGGIEFFIDGGGAVITTGIKGWLEVPFACAIRSVRLLADQSGAIKVDLWVDSYANYPPTNADTITGGNEPEISASGIKAEDETLTDWTLTLSKGDLIYYNVDSVATIEQCLVTLMVDKS